MTLHAASCRAQAGLHKGSGLSLASISTGTSTKMTTWQRWPVPSPRSGGSRHYWGAAASSAAWGGWCPVWFAPTDCPWPPPAWTGPQEPPSRQGPRRRGTCCPRGRQQLKTQDKKLWEDGRSEVGRALQQLEETIPGGLNLPPPCPPQLPGTVCS